MLSRAVEAQKSAPVQKSTAKTPISLAKQLFPSSSPTIEDAFKAAPQSSYSSSHGTGRRGPLATSALKPTAPATMNGASVTRYSGMATNGVKRTLSQSLGLPTNKDSFAEKPLIRGSSAALYNSTLTSLHDAVYFDENDFDDDDDLDFNSPVVKTSVSQPLPQAPPPVADAVPDSDQRFPWSSSPLEHKSPPHREDAMRRAVVNGFESIAPPRRKLPWLEADRESDRTQIKVNDRSRAARAARASLQQSKKPKTETDTHRNEQFTPLPKDNAGGDSYAWNKTQSAVKEDQKKLRQTNKVLVKMNEATEEGKALAIAEKKKKNKAQVFLSDEQRRVQELVVDKGKSVFFTGSAGTGKSVLLRSIISALRHKYKNETDRVAVTASTGLAACNIGGVTLHSFGGIGLGKEAIPDLVKKIKRNAKARTRWMRTKVLIIDEISMVDADLFDKLEGIARTVRNNGRPFGGIQLVITGDYFQLPPVPDHGRMAKFAFEAAAWSTCLEHKVSLTQVFRQKDPIFAQMLNEMRLGKMSPLSINIFKKLCRPIHYVDGLEATELFPTRHEVDNANTVRMRNLPGQSMIFAAFDSGQITDKAQRDKLLSNCMAAQSIELKIGSQVMLIKNMDDSLVNGSLGKVIDFMDEKTFDLYHQDEDEYRAVKDMDSDDESMDRSRKKLKAMLNKNLLGDTGRKWPLVRFAVADGTSRDLLCQPETWKIELPNGDIQAQRQQIPLILAWALSIHKAQGQTLERVKVDLGRVFEKGQAYVALSRATCQEGLQVLRFDPAKVMAHEKVRTFYSKLDTVKSQKKTPVVEEDEFFYDDKEELQAMAC